MSSRQVMRKRGTQHPPARLPAPARAVSKRPAAQQLDDEDEGSVRRPTRAHARGRKRRSLFDGKRSKETNEWIFAGSVFVVLILAVVLGIHFIGGAKSSAANNANNPPGLAGGPVRIGGGGQNNTVVLAAVASALGISSDTLAADLQAGQTVPQIAAAQNVSISTVNTAYLNAVKQSFDSLVSSGQFTQAQADQVYSQQQQAVASGQYPILQAFASATATATP